MTPTNLILGFLGAGKTTAILNLLEQKPADQTWAVLVNEFGEIGLDGAIYASQNAVVRELPGGCLCCSLGVPFQVAVNRILAEIKPDRLIIEPTGLGHPKKILDQLTGGYFRQALDVRASICLLDLRKLKDARYTANENFLDQIALADVLVANKMDLADAAAVTLFHRWVKTGNPVKTVSAQTRHGRIPAAWLDLPRHAERSALFPEAHGPDVRGRDMALALKNTAASGPKPDYRSEGQVYPPGSRFDYLRLYDVLAGQQIIRIKAVIATDKGWFIFNAVDGLLDCMRIQPGQGSRIELVLRQEETTSLWAEINRCLLSPDSSIS
ncbi:MAG: CobW family GTP-binding protein [Methylosarcina sp.]